MLKKYIGLKCLRSSFILPNYLKDIPLTLHFGVWETHPVVTLILVTVGEKVVVHTLYHIIIIIFLHLVILQNKNNRFVAHLPAKYLMAAYQL